MSITMLKPIAILTTSQITYFKARTKVGSSTGKLEQFLDQGYRVYVVSTRSKFVEETDGWWKPLVNEQDICFATEEDYDAGWKKVFAKIDIDYPTREACKIPALENREDILKEYEEYMEKYPDRTRRATRIKNRKLSELEMPANWLMARSYLREISGKHHKDAIVLSPRY